MIPVVGVLVDPTTATPLALHTPPPPSVSDSELPAQMLPAPVMAAGCVFTVMILVVVQPVGNVNVIMPVPVVTPVTTPAPATVMAGLVVAHVPRLPSDSVMVAPGHTLSLPLMAAGSGFTVTMAVIWTVPQLIVTL